MIVDLAMWTKNSERTLDAVLTRIEQVIPEQSVNHKFIIDDKSVDRTVEIAKQHGWDVYPNPDWGITSGANEALRRVETDRWVSFEHDLLLSKDWWRVVPKHLEREKVVIAQGIRLATNPLIRELDTYIAGRIREQWESFVRFRSLDNTIYKTEVLRALGGFPRRCPVHYDIILWNLLLKKGYVWFPDSTVISSHIRESIVGDIRHRKYMSKLSGLCTCENRGERIVVNLKHLAFSPFRGIIVAVNRRNLQLAPLYILYRVEMFWGSISTKVSLRPE